MRFTRAAKVAAFPLLAMVLVVALIACQGPAGPAGKDATAVPGTTGLTGKDAPPGLDAAAIPVQVFGPIAEDAASVKMVDVSAGFTGGTAEGRKYRIATAINVFGGLTYSIDGDTGLLTLTVAMGTDAPTEPTDDTMILVEATDAPPDDANDVAHVKVRLNAVPTVAGTALTVVVGTQPGDTADGTDADDKPDNYATEAGVECVELNRCSVTLEATDFNIRDPVSWDFYTTSDKIEVVPTENGVMITGKESTNVAGTPTPVDVWVWALDDLSRAEGPVLRPEDDGDPDTTNDGDDTSTDWDETKVPAGAREINVTVDGALRTNNTVESLTMDVDDMEVVGKIIDPEGAAIDPAGFEVTGHDSDIATLTLAALADGRQDMTVESHNSGTTTFNVKVTETDNSSGETANPAQYVTHTFTVTVRQETSPDE